MGDVESTEKVTNSWGRGLICSSHCESVGLQDSVPRQVGSVSYQGTPLRSDWSTSRLEDENNHIERRVNSNILSTHRQQFCGGSRNAFSASSLRVVSKFAFAVAATFNHRPCSLSGAYFWSQRPKATSGDPHTEDSMLQLS